MADTTQRALLVLDFQVGAADAPFATGAVQQTALALDAARHSNCSVAFSMIDFLEGYADVSPSNKVFSQIKAKQLFTPGSAKIIDEVQPHDHEHVFRKNRFNALSGNNLADYLRAQSINAVALCGITTSGVVLSTFSELIDRDFEVTILADACADTELALHKALMGDLFPRSANVLTVSAWSKALPSNPDGSA